MGVMGGPGEAFTFKIMQVLTGHGCFDDYLRQIGAEAKCDADIHKAQHTAEE